ncbi:MAG: glycosyltransferase [Bacteroidetes bacterium]|nr:MAG: glycosyltransferase [Bacteroidota bacterium]
MDISVVIPLYNEEESLPELVSWIARVMKEHGFSYEIIMIDDGSRDGSWEVIKALKQSYPAIKAIRFQRNYGKSAALNEGFMAAEGKVVITMDADMQDSPDEIPHLYRMIKEEGYDLVSGYKKKRFDPISKTIPSKFYNWVTRKVSGIPNLHDFNCGLKAYRKEVIKNIEVYGEMHRFIPLMAKWAGFDKIGEKVVQHRPRKYGVTKFGLNRFVNGFLDLITIVFTHRYLKQPMHFFGTWGVLFVLVGGGVLAYLASIKLLGGMLGNRVPALVFGTVTFLLGFLLFSTGLLAELISRNSPFKNEYRIKEKIE